MGKTKLPFRLHTHRSGFIYVRFRHAGVDYDRSTGTRNAIEALGKARGVYNAIVNPAVPAPPKEAISFFPVAEDWLRECEIDTETRSIYRGYVRTWVEFFRPRRRDGKLALHDDVHEIKGRVEEYCYWRAAEVLRATIRKELAALRSFVRFLARRKVFAEFPVEMVAGLKGKRFNPERKRTGKLLSREDVAAIFAHLSPELQDYYTVLYETGLRPATLALLEYGKHFMTSLHTLNITEEIDKTDFARVLPLTDAAHAALCRKASSNGTGGRIFGAHDHRKALAKAAKKAGLEGVTEYDFRHSRITHWIDAGASLTGVQFLAGHKQLGTTSKYAKPSEAAARQALELDGKEEDQ